MEGQSFTRTLTILEDAAETEALFIGECGIWGIHSSGAYDATTVEFAFEGALGKEEPADAAFRPILLADKTRYVVAIDYNVEDFHVVEPRNFGCCRWVRLVARTVAPADDVQAAERTVEVVVGPIA